MSKSQALIYLRVSTGKQAAKELPIATQREACLRLVASRGLIANPEKDIYEDKVSGRRIAGRPGLHLLMERCEASDVEAVVVYDISRLSRNAMEYHALRERLRRKGIKLLSVNEMLSEDESSASWLMEFMLSGFAEFRSRQDGEKIRRSMRSKAKSGGWCGRAPYGYKNVQEQISSSKRRRWIEPDEMEAPWVRRCHDLFETGAHTLRSLAETLSKEGMPLRRGRIIHPSNIERILKDEVYIGVVQWGGVRCESGKHQALVSRKQFEKNNLILRGRSAGSSRKRRHFFVVRALGATCGECGSRWTAGYHRGRAGKQYGKYSCSKKKDNSLMLCGQPSVPIEALESQFQELLQGIALAPRVVERLGERIRELVGQEEATTRELRAEVQVRLAALEEQERRLLDKYVEGRIADQLYETKAEALQREKAILRARLNNIKAELKESEEILTMALFLSQHCGEASKLVKNAELRAVLAEPLFEKIVVRNQEIDRVQLRVPFSFFDQSFRSEAKWFKLDSYGGPPATVRERQEAPPISRQTDSSLMSLLKDTIEKVDLEQVLRLERAVAVLKQVGVVPSRVVDQ